MEMSGKICPLCRKGRLEEKSIHDDIDGVVRCDCGAVFPRHASLCDSCSKSGERCPVWEPEKEVYECVEYLAGADEGRPE